MQPTYRRTLWHHFAAAIDMLHNAITLCPEPLWTREKRFFFLSYHTTIFLDYYLSRPVRDFDPALPFALALEDDLPPEAVDDVLPVQHFSLAEMLDYLAAIRVKCRSLILDTPAEAFDQPWIEPAEVGLHGLCPAMVEHFTLLDILLYNLRHVQHHVAQLHVCLRRHTNQAPDWIALAD